MAFLLLLNENLICSYLMVGIIKENDLLTSVGIGREIEKEVVLFAISGHFLCTMNISIFPFIQGKGIFIIILNGFIILRRIKSSQSDKF